MGLSMSDKDFEKQVEQAAEKTGIKKSRLRDIMSRTKGPDGKLYSGEEGRQLQKKQKAEQEYKARNDKLKKPQFDVPKQVKRNPGPIESGDYQGKKKGN